MYFKHAGRGCKDALREVGRLLKAKYDYVVEVLFSLETAHVRECQSVYR